MQPTWSKQAGTLNVILVANCQTEPDYLFLFWYDIHALERAGMRVFLRERKRAHSGGCNGGYP